MIHQRRPGLLLSAMLTITVPAVTAVCTALLHGSVEHQEHTVVTAAGVESAAAMAAATAPTPRPAAKPKGKGMRLLTQAAAASLATSYQGVELVSRSGVDGTSTVMSNVWHRAGGLTLMRTSSVGASPQDSAELSYDSNGQDPDGVFGVTKSMVSLLAAHYSVRYSGLDSIAGRSALVVAVHRADGSIAARFWLDKVTMVPLGREEYDPSATLISDDLFVDVKFGSAAIPGQYSDVVSDEPPVPVSNITAMKAAAAIRMVNQLGAPGPKAVKPSWRVLPATPTLITSLRGKGWSLPVVLPGGLSLYSAAASGSVVDLGYSDGLFAVSLFVQPGNLAGVMPGAQRLAVNGHIVYSFGHGIMWSGHGFVYTVLADAPPQTVAAAVATLPHDSPPGFWRRLGRGLGRLASMVNPFP